MISTARAIAALALATVATTAGAQTAAAPEPLPAAPLVLFVGNSLTYANDLPALVRAEARARGRAVRTRMIAYPGFSLEDHWHLGLADSIRSIAPDFVVMQQGPSSLPESRAQLVAWTDSVARVARAAGAEPIVLMVWPPLERAFAWDAVRDSYVAAALAAGARVARAGERIREALAADPAAPLLAADGFHPALAGSRVAAAAVADVLLSEP